MELRCSVIINTYNRAPFLRRLLAALGHLQDPTFEVIVVNGPSTDMTADVLAPYHGRIKVRTCAERNLCISRNIGIEAAAGDIVMFIDDDALPCDERWVRRYAEAFAVARDRPLGAVGGPVWNRDTAWAEFNGGLTDEYGFQIFEAGGEAFDAKRWMPRVAGGNCAFSRQALQAIGGFDEYFVYYHDETDVCVRLARAGYAVEHLPDNGIRHYPAPTSGRSGAPARNWTVITRSDTYFALKNAQASRPVKLARTLAYAPSKHYFREINKYFVDRQITPRQWVSLLGRWARGVAEGCRAGLFAPRQVRAMATPDEPFVPFGRPQAAHGRSLSIALLTQSLPGRPDVGGIGRYTYDLALGLHERGHRVHIICRAPASIVHRTPGFAIHGIRPEEAQPYTLVAERPISNKNASYALAVLRKLREIYADGESMDIVHASNWDAEGAAVVRAGTVPVVMTLVSPLAQVIQTERWEINEDLALSLAFDTWQIHAATTVALPSQGVLSSYRNLMGLDDTTLRRVRQLPLGILTDVGPASPAPKSRRRLLFVGRLERRKGAHVLLDVLPDLLTRFADWECVLAGNDAVPVMADGSTLRQHFDAQHAQASWRSRVDFRGIVPEAELAALYQSCDVFVAPSLFESFGLVYHEAMQYGKPVIGCATGGVPEVVTDGVDGLLVPPDAAPELARALATLMADDEQRTRLGAAGRRRVHEQQNHQTMAVAAEAIYFETLEGADAASAARRQRWPRRLPIHAVDGPHAPRRSDADWHVQAGPGDRSYVMASRANAHLTVDAPAGHRLDVTMLRHSWSGVLEIVRDGERLALVNLFAEQLDPTHVVSVELPGDVNETVAVIFRVHPERDPDSRGHEVWLGDVTAVPLAS